jgi:4-aminobutyrate aminotransferase
MVDSIKANSISTFGGNPLASTFALENLNMIVEERYQERAYKLGSTLFEGLKPLEDRYDVVGEVRGKGLLVGLELVDDGESKAPSARLAGRVQEACKDRGLLVGKGGLYGNVLRLAPPIGPLTEEDVHQAVETLDAAIGEAAAR